MVFAVKVMVVVFQQQQAIQLLQANIVVIFVTQTIILILMMQRIVLDARMMEYLLGVLLKKLVILEANCQQIPVIQVALFLLSLHVHAPQDATLMEESVGWMVPPIQGVLIAVKIQNLLQS